MISSASTPPPLFLDSALYYANTNPNVVSISGSTSFQGTGFLTVTGQFSAVGITDHGFNSDAFLNDVTLVFAPEPGLRVLASMTVLLGLAVQWRRNNR